MKRRSLVIVASVLIGFFLGSTCWGLEEIVEKKVFHTKRFRLVSGEKLRHVRIGYETYGTLAPTKDNAILICHYYSGNSHAAGKYTADDPAPGYWDSIIGPGKPLDTDKYFIIASDTLCNVNPKDPNVITTGPATINPKTGEPYGMSFPMVTIEDFVRLQRRLVRFLGVKKLQAVTGASMGGLQTYQWAISYPRFVKRIIPVISTPQTHAWLIGWTELWADFIKQDPNWNNGNYADTQEPVDGMLNAFKLITLSALWCDWAEMGFGRDWADPEKSPHEAMGNEFLIQAYLRQRAAARVATADANHMLYLIKASQLFDISLGYDTFEEALAHLRPKVLMISADTDLLFPASQVAMHADTLEDLGKDVEYFELNTVFGHLGGIFDIAQASEAIIRFMADAE